LAAQLDGRAGRRERPRHSIGLNEIQVTAVAGRNQPKITETPRSLAPFHHRSSARAVGGQACRAASAWCVDDASPSTGGKDAEADRGAQLTITPASFNSRVTRLLRLSLQRLRTTTPGRLGAMERQPRTLGILGKWGGCEKGDVTRMIDMATGTRRGLQYTVAP
jgi:hypothetical protein